MWDWSQAVKHDLSRSTTKLRVQSICVWTCVSVCVCICTHAYVRDHAHTIYTLCMYTHSKWCVNTCITSVRLHSCRIQQRVMFMYASPFQPLHGCMCMYSHTWLYKFQGKPLHCTLTSPWEENMTAHKLRDAGHTTPPSPGKNTHSAMGKTA